MDQELRKRACRNVLRDRIGEIKHQLSRIESGELTRDDFHANLDSMIQDEARTIKRIEQISDEHETLGVGA